MRNELNKIEIIEKYLRDELSATDKKAFEDKLKTDVNLQQEVEIQKEVVKGIERVGVKQSIRKASRRYDKRRRGFLLGIVLLAAISGVMGIINYSDEDIPEKLNAIESTEIIMEVDLKSEPVLEEVLTEVKAIEAVNFPFKKFQYFSINSSKDEKIVGSEGTIIKIKANSFDVPQNSKLKVRLKEYYKMSDIAFSNLTTETKDRKLLETGGMIYIDVKLNGKEAQLVKGKVVEFKFPFEKKKGGMKLFDGELKDEKIVWDEAILSQGLNIEEFEGREVLKNKVFTIVEQMPEIPGGIEKYLSENVLYPKLAKDKGVQGKVFVNLTVGKDGRVRDGKILRGVSELLDKEALRVIQNMPRWRPGMQRGMPVGVSYNLFIDFKLDGSTKSYTPEEIKIFTDSLSAAQGADGDYELFDDKKNAQRKKKSEQLIALSDINYYALSGSRLGWINCDRFIRSGNSVFMVNNGGGYTDVKLIFHSFKSILKGYNNRSFSKFDRVPSGEKVTIFAIKYIDEKPFVCLLETKISNMVVQLEFEELTKTKLEEITNRISKI